MKTTLKYIQFFYFLFLVFSTVIWILNVLKFHYLGNNYFPTTTYSVFCLLLLILLGSILQFGYDHILTQKVQTLILLFTVMFCLVLGANVVQYTPFEPIDSVIFSIQNKIPIPIQEMLYVDRSQKILYSCLVFAYSSLIYQMTYLPFFILLFGKIERIYEYALLLLISGFLGYLVYYFFPTRAPAGIIPTLDFLPEQHATHIKFDEIHAHMKPSTLDGGMVAFPSFHVIWAYLCVFLMRDWRWLRSGLILLNSILVSSCVLLGWHYWLDIIGSMVIILLSHLVMRFCYSLSSHSE